MQRLLSSSRISTRATTVIINHNNNNISIVGWLQLLLLTAVTFLVCFGHCNAQPVPLMLNDNCKDAILVDPLLNDDILGNGTNVRSIKYDARQRPVCYPGSGTCQRFPARALWYKVSPGNITWPIAPSLCDNRTTFPPRMSIYKGNDCNNLEQVFDSYNSRGRICPMYRVFLLPPFSYWIAVSGNFDTAVGNFALTLDTPSRFFALVDATTDQAIDELRKTLDYSYSRRRYRGSVATLSRLNIQAIFSSELASQSVLVTFDNPKRSYCEKRAPFAVFGDRNGNFVNATIPLGTHIVTATPYAQPNCAGPPGEILSETVKAVGCDLFYLFFQYTSVGLIWSRIIQNFSIVPNVPCGMNIQVQPSCDFLLENVRLELRDTATDQIIHARTSAASFEYDLFSSRTYRSGPPNFLGAGNYSIRSIVSGVDHGFTNFTVSGDCF
jgi:hypothetical protein